MYSIHDTRRRRSLVFAALIGACVVAAAFQACQKESEPAGIGARYPYGVLVSNTGCKVSDAPSTRSDAAPNQDCVEWRYSADGMLLLKHVNAGFNCCPGELTADIAISGNEITIVEHEEMAGCHCLCLFDVSYRIVMLPMGVYTVRFVEPYALDDPPLAVTMDLRSDPTGSFCVDRTHYPWHEPTTGIRPRGRIIQTTGCKGALGPADGDDYPTDLSCVEWRLYEGGVLRLLHVNAGFNCCADIGADISVENGTITIVETEGGPPCDCLCLYDVQYEITGITPGAYRLRFQELYTSPEDELLDFTADLAAYPAGVRCAYRAHYPWGYTTSIPEDEAQLAAMARDIREFIGTPSCGFEGDCRYIGIGSKPCGGPWGYLIYSAANTDEYELRRRVLRYYAFNHGMNRRHGLVSTCDVPSPPAPQCVGGICVDGKSRGK